MHAGQFATLPEVLRYYSTLEGAMTGGHHAEQTLQPADLSDRQINDLIAFLESLTTADPPADLLGPPAVR
jgi:cytochrome c peroxidase